MQDNQQQQQQQEGASQSRNESVRVRWKPTAQQITILENIFNSGTVNPTKDVTVSIRKQLQQYGPVEDVNIFYWFQNRRSRWSRRLRQIQTESAAAAAAAGLHSNNNISNTNNNNHIINFHNVAPSPQFYNYNANNNNNSNIHIYNSSSSSSSWDSYTTSTHEQDSGASSSVTLYSDTTHDASMPNITAGCIRVSINGKATKIPKRPVDMRTMFGQELVLVHPNGVPVDEFGFDLQHGECYFLVPRHA